MIKFPTDYEVGEVWGDQVAVHECYIVMFKMDNHLQTMCIEEHRMVAELVEGLEEVILDDARPEQTIRVRALLARQSVRRSQRF